MEEIVLEAEVVVAARNLSTPGTPGRVLVQAYWSPGEWARFVRGRDATLDAGRPRHATILDGIGDTWLLTCAVGLYGPALTAWEAGVTA